MRARACGWRHIVAADVFVRHIGGRSYAGMREPLMARNGRLLEAMYPGYDAMIAAFWREDPLREARRAIDARVLLGKPALLSCW